jgi:hypothetical protein
LAKPTGQQVENDSTEPVPEAERKGGRTEIDKFDMTVSSEHYIFRLQITIHNAFGMEILYCYKNFRHVKCALTFREPSDTEQGQRTKGHKEKIAVKKEIIRPSKMIIQFASSQIIHYHIYFLVVFKPIQSIRKTRNREKHHNSKNEELPIMKLDNKMMIQFGENLHFTE